MVKTHAMRFYVLFVGLYQQLNGYEKSSFLWTVAQYEIQACYFLGSLKWLILLHVIQGYTPSLILEELINTVKLA